MDETETYQQTNMKIMEASYVIALQVAKAKKEYTIGESLLEPCIVESVKLVLGKEASKKMKLIPLSSDTIKNRITEMSENIKKNMVSKILSSPFFSLQLDESTDVANISHLVVFSRYITDKGIEQEFLFSRPLEATTKAVDVMEILTDFFEESGLSWSKLEGVCTDSGPNMLGSRSGFVTLLKKKRPSVKGTHCMINREALVSKTIPKNLRIDLVTIISIVNYIKGSTIDTCLFSILCKDMDVEHTTLLCHTRVRWLSKGNMLARVFKLREEIKLFLSSTGKLDMLSIFSKEGFEARLAYFADIFEALNVLNTKMQEQRSNVIVQTDVIYDFMVKLQLWGEQIGNGNIESFQHLSDIYGEDDKINDQFQKEIIDHLENLRNEFKCYFSGIDTEDTLMWLARNPFMCRVDDVPDGLKDEFLDLTDDSSARVEFRTQDLEDFWVRMRGVYPRLSTNALKILILFPTTNLCESGFSYLLTIKQKTQNRLEVGCDMRCALSTTTPDIKVLMKNKQFQPSN